MTPDAPPPRPADAARAALRRAREDRATVPVLEDRIARLEATIAAQADELVRLRRRHYRELYRVRWRAEHWAPSTATRVRYFSREHDAYAFANRRVHAGFHVVDICRCAAGPWEQVAP